MKRSLFWQNGTVFLGSLLFGGLFLAFPGRVAQGCAEGLNRCLQSLIPALFPFLVLAECLACCPGFLDKLLQPLCRACRLPQDAAPALLLGLLGGFAPGASCLGRLTRQGRLQADQTARAVCFLGSGPSFVVTAVGWGILGNTLAGLVIWLCLTLASVCCLFAVRPKRHSAPSYLLPAQESEPFSFSLAVNRATDSMLHICGTVVLFAVLNQLLFSKLSPAACVLEVTAGCAAAGKQGSLALLCFSLSFLGLCGLLQIRALLPNEVSLAPFLWTRPLHFLVSFLTCRGIFACLPGLVQTSQAASRLIVTSRLPWPSAISFFLFLAIGCSSVSARALRNEISAV